MTLKTKNPKLQFLSEKLYEAVMTCQSYEGNCSVCSGRDKEYRNKVCRLGLETVQEARKIKKYSKIITEEYLAMLDVYSRNYTGAQAGDAFFKAFRRIPKARST